jgi:hypothetical protein
LDALSISHNRTKFWVSLFFLVLEEGNTPLTHLLLADCADDCFLASVIATDCGLVEADSSSRSAQSGSCCPPHTSKTTTTQPSIRNNFAAQLHWRCRSHYPFFAFLYLNS